MTWSFEIYYNSLFESAGLNMTWLTVHPITSGCSINYSLEGLKVYKKFNGKLKFIGTEAELLRDYYIWLINGTYPLRILVRIKQNGNYITDSTGITIDEESIVTCLELASLEIDFDNNIVSVPLTWKCLQTAFEKYTKEDINILTNNNIDHNYYSVLKVYHASGGSVPEISFPRSGLGTDILLNNQEWTELTLGSFFNKYDFYLDDLSNWTLENTYLLHTFEGDEFTPDYVVTDSSSLPAGADGEIGYAQFENNYWIYNGTDAVWEEYEGKAYFRYGLSRSVVNPTTTHVYMKYSDRNMLLNLVLAQLTDESHNNFSGDLIRYGSCHIFDHYDYLLNVYLLQKSDAKYPRANISATNGVTTIEQLLLWYKDLFNLDYFIKDNGELYVYHQWETFPDRAEYDSNLFDILDLRTYYNNNWSKLNNRFVNDYNEKKRGIKVSFEKQLCCLNDFDTFEKIFHFDKTEWDNRDHPELNLDLKGVMYGLTLDKIQDDGFCLYAYNTTPYYIVNYNGLSNSSRGIFFEGLTKKVYPVIETLKIPIPDLTTFTGRNSVRLTLSENLESMFTKPENYYNFAVKEITIPLDNDFADLKLQNDWL